MTYAPDSLKQLGAYWVAQGGVNLGIVGNMAHCTGYHLGRDRIFGTCACRPTDICVPGKREADYSVQHERDRAGLSNAASAIDLGKLGGSFAGLYNFSEWLVARCLRKAVGTSDIREVIYWSAKNKRVQRYSGVDGEVHWGDGNGDASHQWHTHISYFRDSEARDKTSAFIPYFTGLPPTDTEEDMATYVDATVFPSGPRAWSVAKGVTLNGYDPRQPGKVVKTATFTTSSGAQADAEVYVSYSTPKPWPVPNGGPFLRVADGIFAGLLIVKSLVTLAPEVPVVIDCSAEIKAATDPLRAAIARKDDALRLIAAEATHAQS